MSARLRGVIDHHGLGPTLGPYTAVLCRTRGRGRE